MKSRVIVLGGTEASPTATVQGEATFSDIFSTMLSGTECVTGTYKYVQEGILFLGGMVTQNMRLGQGFNPFKKAE